MAYGNDKAKANMRGMGSEEYVLVVQTPSQAQAYKDCVREGDAVFYLDDTHQTSGYNLKLVCYARHEHAPPLSSSPQVNLLGTTRWGTITTLGHCITSSVSLPIVTNFLLALRHRCEWLAPSAVVTDGDKTLWAAVAEAFPSAGHYLCCWHFSKALYVYSLSALYKKVHAHSYI